MFYIVSTPIGNLGDFSYRAQEILQSVDYILCEDTRTSAVLLNHYDLKKPLRSFHKFNEKKEEERIIEDLKTGKSIALISDAGTPGISDPGEMLIHAIIKEDLPLTIIPGPAAFLAALQLSGFKTTPFQFVGFLPKKSGELRSFLTTILTYRGTTVLYESPHRLIHLLETLPSSREVSASREITKRFEETIRGSAEQVLNHFQKHPPRGEFVIVINEGDEKLTPPPTLEEAAESLLKTGVSKASMIRSLSQQFQISKKEVTKRLK